MEIGSRSSNGSVLVAPDEASKFAGYVQGRRRLARLTQQKTANLAGCSLSALTAIEAGAVPKRSRVAARILDVINAEIEALEEQRA
jgi:DNA-binding XRE family transcriptional regulator